MNHEKLEKNIGLMIIVMVIALSFGTLTELTPLFFQKDMTEPVDGLKPLTGMQLAGRDIYIREGCNNCHSQMIRPLRAETERYGHYSVAGEFVYDFPHLWGSKRTGPDLARVGARYSDDWHKLHMHNPRDVVPGSIMPSYPWLFDQTVDGEVIEKSMKVLKFLGVPYSDEQITKYAKAAKDKPEIDALIEYLQQLGTVIQHKR